jgi:hypothetical protein
MLTKSQNELVDRIVAKSRPITKADVFKVVNGLLDKYFELERKHQEDLFAARVQFWREGFELGFSNRSHLAALQHLEAWKGDPAVKWLGDAE